TSAVQGLPSSMQAAPSSTSLSRQRPLLSQVSGAVQPSRSRDPHGVPGARATWRQAPSWQLSSVQSLASASQPAPSAAWLARQVPEPSQLSGAVHVSSTAEPQAVPRAEAGWRQAPAWQTSSVQGLASGAQAVPSGRSPRPQTPVPSQRSGP